MQMRRGGSFSLHELAGAEAAGQQYILVEGGSRACQTSAIVGNGLTSNWEGGMKPMQHWEGVPAAQEWESFDSSPGRRGVNEKTKTYSLRNKCQEGLREGS